MNIIHKSLLLFVILVVFVDCGGGGGEGGTSPALNQPSSKMLSGTAAAGAPIAGKVNVKGANGSSATSSIGIDGSFSLDVSALTAPYILFAEGSVNGKSVKVYSAAVTTGTINITQVTDFIVRNAFAGSTETAYASWSPTSVTDTALTTAATDVAIMLEPLLTAVGASGTDLLTTPFTADSTGIDAALDALTISYSGATGTIATVTSTLSGSSFTDDVTTSGVVGGLPAVETTTISTILTDQDAINDVWQIAIDLYSTARPSDMDLTAWFMNYVASDYLENGVDRSTELNSWLNGEGPDVGFNISAVIVGSISVASYVKAYQVRLRYTGSVTETFSAVMVYDGAGWRWFGNQAWVEANADAHAFLSTGGLSADLYYTGFEFYINDDNNYAYSQGVRSAVITGPGLPDTGLVFAHLFDFTAENEFGLYKSDGTAGGSFYVISATNNLNDSAVTGIPDNAVYTFTLCTQAPDVVFADISTCDAVFATTSTSMKPPLPISSLTTSNFAVLTSPSSHLFSSFPIGTVFNVSWTKPAETTSGEVGFAINNLWISSDPGSEATTTELDTIGVSADLTSYAGLFIRVEDMWGRDFNLGWDIYNSAPIF